MKLFYLTWPKRRSAVNYVWSRPKLPILLMIALTVGLLVGIHFLMARILILMDMVPLIGLVLKNYLLSGVLLCLLFLLVFSNVINALSALFLSRDLEFVFASPAPYSRIFAAKFTEILVRSSWMVVLLLAPVLTAYATSYGGGMVFYLAALPILVPYFVLCTGVGVTIALLLAAALPVRKATTVLRFLFIMSIGIAIVLLRVLQPEQLIDPERFENFGRFLLALHSPFATDLPSYWVSRIFICFMTMEFFAIGHFVLRYLLCSLAALTMAYGAARYYHIRGWRRIRHGAGGEPAAAPGDEASHGRARGWSLPSVFARGLSAWLRLGRVATARLVEKELLVFARSPVLWTQTALLAVIVVIYVYNIRLLPAEALASLRADLPAITAFCNVAFIAFITTAAALRFGFPSISMEGRMLRLILSSPFSPRAYLAVKYWCSAFPLAVLAVILALSSSYFLETALVVSVIVTLDAFLLALAISALALLFGVLYADLDAENFAELPSGWGGMLFMVGALVLTALFLALQAYPCYIHFLATTSLFRPDGLQTVAALSGLLTSMALAMGTAWYARLLAGRLVTKLP